MPRTTIKVRVPKGFNYEEARKAHWQEIEQPEINRHCIESAEESLEQYQSFERYYFDKEGREFEYQEILIYYNLPPQAVSDRDSVEDMIHNAAFWDEILG